MLFLVVSRPTHRSRSQEQRDEQAHTQRGVLLLLGGGKEVANCITVATTVSARTATAVAATTTTSPSLPTLSVVS